MSKENVLVNLYARSKIMKVFGGGENVGNV
jgi:hypothetical protein